MCGESEDGGGIGAAQGRIVTGLAESDGTGWEPVAFTNPDDVRVEFWRSPLSAEFVDQLENDLIGLRQRATAETAAYGGSLIDVVRVMMDGRHALLRVEKLAADIRDAVTYAASLLIAHDEDFLVEVTITCSGQGVGDGAADVGEMPLTRVLRVVEEIRPELRLLVL